MEKMNLSGVCKLASATCAIKNNGDAVVVETGKKIAEDCIFGDDIYTYGSLRGQETAVVLISKNGTIYTCEIPYYNVTTTTCESLSGKTKVYDEWLLGMK